VAAAPCGESVKLSSSGAEATFYALRLARAFTKRDKILKFDGAYHGHHDYAMMGSRGDNYPVATPDSRGIPAPVAGTVLLSAFNDIELTRRIITEHAHELAAVIVEPVQRVIPPAPGFLEMLREVTTASGIVLIFDEVVTGFRVAWGGAQEYFGVTADLATYGKAIGGGFPVSAVAGRAEILALANPLKFSGPDLVYISGTLNGNPVGAAAGVATLEVLREPGVYPQLWARSSRLKTEVEAAAKRLGIGLQLAAFGPVLRSVFTDREVKSHADLKSGDPVKNDKFCRALLRRGVFWNPDKTYVSTAHTDEDIARTIQAAEESLRELAQQA
jgi:glutamate-1-semialdehyde 2,1-aminomutase